MAIDVVVDRGEDGTIVLGANQGAPDRFADATAAGGPDRWLLTTIPLEDPDHAVGVVHAVLGAVAAHGGGPVTWWTHPSAPSDDGLTDGRDEVLATAVGLQRTRELYELARPLPAPSGERAAVRSMRPGDEADAEALLRVNNRSFDWHPDQAGWDRGRLETAIADGDLVADDVVLAERDGEVAGFCWTKVHSHRTPPEGEIFVIGVDPAHQGHGLGRALTLAGLDHLHQQHGTTVGMLFVESINAPALALYGDLGFEHRRTLRCYERTVEPVSA